MLRRKTNQYGTIMQNRYAFLTAVCFFLCFSAAAVVNGQQIMDEEQRIRQRQSSLPRAIDFGELFMKDKMDQEEYNIWKRQRAARLQERLQRIEALEASVDPERYIVGPGDVFSFNIWNMNQHIYLPVTPSGDLLIPSVGAVHVGGKILNEAIKQILDSAQPFYENASLSASLEAMRAFRVHVVGEVKFPGTHVTMAVERVSELITLSGGVTERAWKGGIQIRHLDGSHTIFDLSAFEVDGDLTSNIFLTGGDVIYVPGVDLDDPQVKVESNQEFAGTYRIHPGEDLYDFLRRIRALARNTDLSIIQVVRRSGKESRTFLPYKDRIQETNAFPLQNGDRIFLPGLYVYVKGAVRTPGAFPYVFNATAKEYAGMAGGDFRSGRINSVRTYKAQTGKYLKGADVPVDPGDVIHLDMTWNHRFENYLRILSAITSLLLAAKAAGLLGD